MRRPFPFLTRATLALLSAYALAACGTNAETREETALREVSPWDACGPREWQVTDGAGGAVCECQPRFAGPDCATCAEGYEGPTCSACAEGYAPSDRLGGGFDPDPADPREKSWATVAWDLRCEPAPTRGCDALDCGAHGTCDPGDGYASCVCEPGTTGAACDACAPLYEADAGGACVLGQTCRDRVCGGAGDCVADAAGGISCDCDAATVDPRCGATAEPTMLDDAGAPAEWRSLYPGESVALDLPTDPTDGQPFPLVATGPLTVDDRAAVSCPPGADARVTASAEPGDGIVFAELTVDLGSTEPVSPTLDLAIVPSEYVPITGTVHAELEPVYENLLRFMRARGIRGAAIGISKGGVTVARNGLGYRDPGLDADPWEHANEGTNRVLPSTPFRLASLSKPVTAAAVRAAADEAGISLDSTSPGERAADLVDASLGVDLVNDGVAYPYSVQPGGRETRWAQVTLRHLLNHHAGFVRDQQHASTQGRPDLATNRIPGATIGGSPQADLSYLNTSWDIFFSTGLYAIGALNLTADPVVAHDAMVRLVGGVAMDYTPGQSVGGNDGYSNFGYTLLGRALEGIAGETYDPEEPGAPYGWGAYPGLVQDFLCPLGITPAGFFPGDGRPRNGEPAYRDLDRNGQEQLANWDLSDPLRMRTVQSDGELRYEACTRTDSEDCDPFDDAGWTTNANTPAAYGGTPMGVLGAAGGWVANVDSYLRFARRYRTSVGAPNAGDAGSGSALPSPGNYPSSTAHNGALAGTWNFVWQLGGETRSIVLPFEQGVWTEDLPAAPVTDPQGLVVVQENLRPATPCTYPDDVAVVLFLNQRQDYRAPAGTISNLSNTTLGTVYGRVRDFVLGGVCEVTDWPTPAPSEVLAIAPVCG